MGKMKDLLGDMDSTNDVKTQDLANEFAADWSEEEETVAEQTTTPVVETEHPDYLKPLVDCDALDWGDGLGEEDKTDADESQPEPMSFATLADRTFLARLTMTAYSDDVTDKAASVELATLKHASEKAVTVKKKLLPNCSALQELYNLSASIRSEHLERSMAWEDRGARLVPDTNTFGYWAFAREAKSKHAAAKQKLGNQYDWALQRTHIELGDLWEPDLYLPKQVVLDKFTIEFDYSDVPSGDLRVIDNNDEINEEMAILREEARDDARKSHARSLSRVGNKAWADLLDPLCNMIWQLREENHDGSIQGFRCPKKGKFEDEPITPSYKDTLVGNVVREIDLLDAWFLQVAKGLDPSMDAVVNKVVRLTSNFRQIDVENLKEITHLRQSTRDFALKILVAVPKEARDAKLQKTLRQKQTGAAAERVQVLNLVP